MKEFKLRPHHGMCVLHFQGKGYSDEFCCHMVQTIKYLNEENPLIRLTCGSDEICKACPNRREGGCVAEEKVSKIDKGCLEKTGLEESSLMKYSEYAKLIQSKIILKDVGKKICGDCQWKKLCY